MPAPAVQFSPQSLTILNVCLSIIMLGVALEIKREHFLELVNEKKAIITGLLAQLVLLPFLTFLLVSLLPLSPGLALGMMLVAACPGGNVSNFFSNWAKGNVALSVSLTAFSSLLAFVLTPLNFFFWSSLLPHLSTEVKTFSVDFWSLFLNMIAILLLPLLLGMWVAEKYPRLTTKISKPLQWISLFILATFILVAIKNNAEVFMNGFGQVFWIVLIHNGTALLAAYYFSAWLKNNEANNRTIAIETGIQNSGLGLILIFTFFDGHAEMALVAAWWGVWHLISGFAFASWMRWRTLPSLRA